MDVQEVCVPTADLAPERARGPRVPGGKLVWREARGSQEGNRFGETRVGPRWGIGLAGLQSGRDARGPRGNRFGETPAVPGGKSIRCQPQRGEIKQPRAAPWVYVRHTH